jgi:hypothetical protein
MSDQLKDISEYERWELWHKSESIGSKYQITLKWTPLSAVVSPAPRPEA